MERVRAVETNIERIMREELERRGYKNKKDFEMFFPVRSGFILDFAFIKQRVGVECDGEKWHSSFEARNRDGFRDYIIKRGGWVIIRFWGNQIINNVKECVDKIEELLK